MKDYAQSTIRTKPDHKLSALVQLTYHERKSQQKFPVTSQTQL